MSSHDLDRVRRDLSTMRNALGFGLPCSEADAWFHAAMAAACGVYGILNWPGSPWFVASGWAAAPIWATGAACIAYIALKARTLPPREESRRSEYKRGLVAFAFIIPAAAAYGKWSKYAGLTPAQLQGSGLAMMGAALFVVGLAKPPAHYPRSFFRVVAVPLMLFGLLIPIAPASYTRALIGLMGLVTMSLSALMTHRHVRRFREETAEHVSH